MEHVKELLKSRIEGIHDPVQRILLQDVLADVFTELLQYSEERYARLENKLDMETGDSLRQYYIYTGVCKREDIDNTSRCLFEIKTGQAYGTGYLGRIFLACGYPVIRQCISREYKAQVITDKGEYETVVSLRYCHAYLDAIGHLYHQFNLSQKQWHTINCPFLYKMLDIVDTKGVVPCDEAVQKVEIMLGELSEYVIYDAVLVWNVQEEIYKPSVETAAADNEGVYIHKIFLQDKVSGYLAAPEGEDFFWTVFSEDNILVHTRKRAHEKMKLLKVAHMDINKDLTGLLYPLQSNYRNMRHVDRQALNNPRCIWTEGETRRILSSYEVFNEFELLDICMDLQGDIPGIDTNHFIKSNSLLKSRRKVALVLHPKDSKDIFRYEKMFFLLSELQLCAAEYEWTGILK